MKLFLGLEDLPEWMFNDNHRWTKREMWLYMLFRTARERKTIYSTGMNITILAGQLVMPIKEMQSLGKWGKRASHEFREELEEMGWIQMEHAPWMPTVITIIDFKKYYLDGKSRTEKIKKKTLPDGDYS